MEFQIAELTPNQKEQLKSLEEELDVVLIAWEKNNKDSFYKLHEDDRL